MQQMYQDNYRQDCQCGKVQERTFGSNGTGSASCFKKAAQTSLTVTSQNKHNAIGSITAPRSLQFYEREAQDIPRDMSFIK